MDDTQLTNLRKAGEIHRAVREWIIPNIHVGIKLMDLADMIEAKIKELTKYDPANPRNAGIAFPTGLSVNNCAAHWTPNPSDTTVILNTNDVIKIDYGVHIGGQIVDSAFTHVFNPVYKPLVECAIDATTTAIKASGVDAILGEIGGLIEETILSYEMDLNGTVYQLHPVRELCGHNILPYKIHGSKVVPNIYMPNYQMRMECGEVFAIETFPTTGSAILTPDMTQVSHFMIDYTNPLSNVIRAKTNKDRKVLHNIKKERGTLAFCPRWLPTQFDLLPLVKQKIIKGYPPLYDVQGSYVSQHEQTIYISDHGVELMS
jgi:methionyl aminopeptidase